MLKIHVSGSEIYDESSEEFVVVKPIDLVLEHSLISISKWEAKWHKPFLKDEKKSDEELLDYVRCMTLTQNVDPVVYLSLTKENLEAILSYINDSMTATTFSNQRGTPQHEVYTSELIYYYMIAAGVPIECQKWHLNRLLTLLKICGIKASKTKSMSKGAILKQNSALNAARRAKLGSKG